jgi:L-seryl-tRNA(Ser) seleniumtransferase
MSDTRSTLRDLPSTSALMRTEEFEAMATTFGLAPSKFELRALVDEYRAGIQAGSLGQIPAPDGLFAALREHLVRLLLPEGRRAINATGILLHTGLGRSPLCREALDAIAQFDRYSLLQADLEAGGRGFREQKVERILRELTGCEAVCVVNNNAAAAMLVLSTLAAPGEVIISRGELVEIGGSFRVPDVLAQSGAVLREVGTTNRTHLRDYEAAISNETAAILRVHPSNYRIRGFVAAPPLAELVALARRRGVLIIEDLGSGALVPLAPYGLPNEPLVRDVVASGVDVCCFSGDKLISGPQAGIIVGKRVLVERVRKSPFARMFRVCKLTLAALEATLCQYLGEAFRETIPLYRMLSRTQGELQDQAERLSLLIGSVPDAQLDVVDHSSYVGSGSVPDLGIPSRALRLRHVTRSARDLAQRLRQSLPAVFGHVTGDCLLLDMRTVLPDELAELARATHTALY